MKAEGSYPDFEVMKRQERAAYLLAGYIQYDLTTEEEEELDRWINASDDNLKLFEELTDEKRLAEYLAWYQSRNLESRLEETRQQVFPVKTSMLRSFRKYAAVAAVLITTGMIVHVWRQSSTPQIEKPPVITATPGQASEPLLPVLKMDDGRIIQLAGVNDTVISDQVRIRNGGIVYEGRAATPAAPAFHEVIIPRKMTYRLTLPDGTKVWLNAASSIRYHSSFTGDTREVTVTGETYFEIAKDVSKPFIVTVNNIKVQATGTAFNIKAYPGEPFLGITLTKGAVRITNGNKMRNLRPSQQLQIRNKENWKSAEVETDAVTAWTVDKLDLGGASIEELKGNLERWYDIDVTIQGKIDKHLAGSFPRDISLTTLLKMLEATNEVHFDLKGNRLTILK